MTDSSLSVALRAVDAIETRPEPAPEPPADAVGDQLAREVGAHAARSATWLNNGHLARSACAESAVAVVLRQKGLENPTLKSVWTRAEILRLLDDLFRDPGAPILLGGQHLGEGFA